MNTKKETNCLSVPLYAVIIFIIILTFLSLKLYDWSLEYTNLSNDIEENNKLEDAISALQVLGYNRKEIEKVFEKIEINNLSVEELIKKGLQILGM